jgi:hypothetical protein
VAVGHARSIAQTPSDTATIDDIRSKLLVARNEAKL